MPILHEAWLQETKKKRKSEPLTPECQTCQASEDTASTRLRKDERVSLRAWTMARCYSGSATELVYPLSCSYTLSGTLDKIEEKSQPQFQGDGADRRAIANHDVASSSYSAAFEHVAGFMKENVLNVSQTVCCVSITSLCDIFTSELHEHGVESVVPFN